MNEPIPALPPASSHPAEQDDHQAGKCPHRRRHGFIAGLVLGVLAAGLIGFAIGATMPVAEAAFGAAAAHHFAGGPLAGGGPPTAEQARDHAQFFAAFALHRLDATPDQQERVEKIVDGAVDELMPVIEMHRANRDELHAVLQAQTVDRAAIEKLRSEEIAAADSHSRLLASAIGDPAEVLTAQQRTELIDHIERFQHRS